MTPVKDIFVSRDEFNLMNFENKLKTIWNTGNFVDAHITSVGESRIINLYKLNEFYVEIIYGDIATNVKSINSYKMGHSMKSYTPTEPKS